MTISEIFRALDQLSANELAQVQAYIQRRADAAFSAKGETSEERILRMDAAVALMRDGLTPEQLEAMTMAMNATYHEPADDELWKD